MKLAVLRLKTITVKIATGLPKKTFIIGTKIVLHIFVRPITIMMNQPRSPSLQFQTLPLFQPKLTSEARKARAKARARKDVQAILPVAIVVAVPTMVATIAPGEKVLLMVRKAKVKVTIPITSSARARREKAKAKVSLASVKVKARVTAVMAPKEKAKARIAM
jgi:hypothetical protein